MKDFKPNTKYRVLTPDGFQAFAGVSNMGNKPILTILFENNIEVECTHDHKFYISLTCTKEAHSLLIGDTVLSKQGPVEIIDIINTGRISPVYDLIEVDNGHRFYANTLLSSNCEFLVFDETLIDSQILSELTGKEPILKTGQTRWYKTPSAGNMYLVSWDPSMGTGGDYAAIQIFELPSLIQVGEWQHNITPIQDQTRILRDILRHIQDCIGHSNTNSIFWSIENNTVGEAGLIVIEDFGEETFPGMFISEPIRKGHVRSFRKGFNTTYGTKISACSRLKFYIESGKLTINSRSLISELKGYVASGNSYKGKSGQHDDLVSALLLIIRISVVLAEWDPTVFEIISTKGHFDDDWEMPLPIYVTSYY